MKRESVIIESFVIDKPKQVKIFEVRIPREVENIIGVELGFNLLEGNIADGSSSSSTTGGSDTPREGKGREGFVLPMKLSRNHSVGELRLQSYSKANLFYAGELAIDRNLDYADFTSQFFSPKAYTHQANSFETEVKLTAKHRLVRGIYRDNLADSITGSYKYRVKLYLWTTKNEKAIKP